MRDWTSRDEGDWVGCAKQVFSACRRLHGVVAFTNPLAQARALMDAVAKAEGKVDDASRVALLARAYPKGFVDRPDGENVADVKAIVLGLALSRDDPTLVTPSEAAALRGQGLSCVRVPDLALPRVSSGVGGFTVPFRFACGILRPRARARLTPAAGAGTAWVERVDAAEAPVAWTLGFADGPGEVVVRDLGGMAVRQVFVAGTRRPATEAEFAALSGGGEAWRDSPFGVRGEAAPLPVSLFGAPVDAPEATASALARCGRLVSVDGLVYRQTKWPTFHLVHDPGSEATLSVEWALTGLDSLSTEDSLDCRWDARRWNLGAPSDSRLPSREVGFGGAARGALMDAAEICADGLMRTWQGRPKVRATSAAGADPHGNDAVAALALGLRRLADAFLGAGQALDVMKSETLANGARILERGDVRGLKRWAKTAADSRVSGPEPDLVRALAAVSERAGAGAYERVADLEDEDEWAAVAATP